MLIACSERRVCAIYTEESETPRSQITSPGLQCPKQSDSKDHGLSTAPSCLVLTDPVLKSS